MNKDFRLAVGYFEHHKIKKLERRLGQDAVLAHLRLLAYVARHRPSGQLGGMDPEDIELAAGWAGESGLFHQNLLELRLIDPQDGQPCIHDWADHNPFASEAEQRGDAARLSRLARINRAAAEGFKRDGRPGITKAEYRAHADGTPYVRRTNDRGTPAPAPSPDPDPDPAPPPTTARPHDWAGFMSLWQVYPCKQSQAEAFAEYCRLRDQNRLEAPGIIRDKIIELANLDSRWLRGIVPSLTNFLRGARWNDQPYIPAEHSPDDHLGRIASEVRSQASPGLQS